MKKILLTIVILLSGCTTDIPQNTKIYERIQSPPPRLEAASAEYDAYTPLNYDCRKGMWISFIDLAPMLSEDNADDFRSTFDIACSEIADLGCNTIYVHVRPFGDAIYDSALFPPSEYICGDYDPLEIICETAHEYDLSVHAWINPLRLQTADKLINFTGFQTVEWFKEGDDKVSSVDEDSHLWLDPAYTEVRELIADGAYEIAENYDIDGILMLSASLKEEWAVLLMNGAGIISQKCAAGYMRVSSQSINE